MLRTINTLLVLVLALPLTMFSCSPKHTDSKPEGVLTNAQEKALRDAKHVDQMLDDANEKRLKQIDEMNK